MYFGTVWSVWVPKKVLVTLFPYKFHIKTKWNIVYKYLKTKLFEFSATIIEGFWVSLNYPILNFKKMACPKSILIWHCKKQHKRNWKIVMSLTMVQVEGGWWNRLMNILEKIYPHIFIKHLIEVNHLTVTLDNFKVLSRVSCNRKFKRKVSILIKQNWTALNKHCTSIPLKLYNCNKTLENMCLLK